MRYQLLFVFTLLFNSFAFSQSDRPKELSPEILAKIKIQVEAQALTFRQSLSKKGLTGTEINFSVDTFRVEQIASKRMDVDYSTAGMSNTVMDKAASYDKLLNKYYKLLLNVLKPADKNVLVSAQRTWIAYRDAESKLIYTMTKQDYSGGGSMQTNIATATYADLIVSRTLKIFDYYNDLVKPD